MPPKKNGPLNFAKGAVGAIRKEAGVIGANAKLFTKEVKTANPYGLKQFFPKSEFTLPAVTSRASAPTGNAHGQVAGASTVNVHEEAQKFIRTAKRNGYEVYPKGDKIMARPGKHR